MSYKPGYRKHYRKTTDFRALFVFIRKATNLDTVKPMKIKVNVFPVKIQAKKYDTDSIIA